MELNEKRRIILIEIPVEFIISGLVYNTLSKMCLKFGWERIEYYNFYKETRVFKLYKDKNFPIIACGTEPVWAHIEYIYDDEYKWLAHDIKYLQFNNFRYYPDGTIEEIK